MDAKGQLPSHEEEHRGGSQRRSRDSQITNQSVLRAFAILKSFYSPGELVAVCELSRRAHISEATINRFMHSLLEVGAVVRHSDGRYRCVLFTMPGAAGPSARGRGHARTGARGDYLAPGTTA